MSQVRTLIASCITVVVILSCASAPATASSLLIADVGGWSYQFDRANQGSTSAWGLSLETHEAFQFDAVSVSYIPSETGNPEYSVSASSGLCWYGSVVTCGAFVGGGSYRDKPSFFGGIEFTTQYRRLGFKARYIPGHNYTIQGRILIWEK